MEHKSKINPELLFNRLKYICSGIAGILLIWLFSTLFFRSIGGPMPYRVRGPLAKQEYERLAELPDWENILIQPGLEGKTSAELLILGEKIPPLEFGNPENSNQTKNQNQANNQQDDN